MAGPIGELTEVDKQVNYTDKHFEFAVFWRFALYLLMPLLLLAGVTWLWLTFLMWDMKSVLDEVLQKTEAIHADNDLSFSPEVVTAAAAWEAEYNVSTARVAAALEELKKGNWTN